MAKLINQSEEVERDINNNACNHLYIQSATLNGKRLDRLCINYNKIINDGVLIYNMNNELNKSCAVGLGKSPRSIR